MTFSITMLFYHAEYHYGECCNLFSIMLNVVMLSVIMLNVIMLKVIMLNVIMLNIIMQNVIMLNVVMLNVVILNVIMLNVVMLNVVAPYLLTLANRKDAISVVLPKVAKASTIVTVACHCRWCYHLKYIANAHKP